MSPDELGSMARALESLRTSALEAERLQLAMSRFTADASHQMRTPLSILRTHISVLGGLIPADNAAYSSLNDIQEAADRLQRLLIQLLKLARADGQSLDRSRRRSICAKSFRRPRPSMCSKRWRPGSTCISRQNNGRSRCEPTRSPSARCSPNLIDNAIRYNDAGGGVVVRLIDDNGKYVVDVEDDGPGIPDAEQEKVFTRFYRL